MTSVSSSGFGAARCVIALAFLNSNHVKNMQQFVLVMHRQICSVGGCCSKPKVPWLCAIPVLTVRLPMLQTLLSHVVTSHVRSAVHGIPAGASMIRAIANVYKLYAQTRSAGQVASSLLA